MAEIPALICCCCKQPKPASNFYQDTSKKRGYSAYCRECHKKRLKTRYAAVKDDPALKLQKRENHLMHSYGLSLQDFESMREFQNNCCAVCGKPFTRKIVVDHNHRTNEVRALTHSKCNITVGFIETNPGITKLVDRYLNNFGR